MQEGDDIGLEGRVVELIERGLERYGAGDLEGALSEWNHALVLDPDNRRVADYVSYIQKHFDLETGMGTATKPAPKPLSKAPEKLAPFPLEEVGPLQDDDVDAYESIEISGDEPEGSRLATVADDGEWAHADWEKTGGGTMRFSGVPANEIAASKSASAAPEKSDPAAEVDDGWDVDAGWDMDMLAGEPKDSPFSGKGEEAEPTDQGGAASDGGDDGESSFADLMEESDEPAGGAAAPGAGDSGDAPEPAASAAAEASFAGLMDESVDDESAMPDSPFDDPQDDTIDRPAPRRGEWRAPSPQAASGHAAGFSDLGTGVEGTAPGEQTGERTTPGGDAELQRTSQLANEVVAALDTVAEQTVSSAVASAIGVDDSGFDERALDGGVRVDDQTYEKTIERTSGGQGTMHDGPPLAALDLDEELTMDRGGVSAPSVETSARRRAPTTDPGLSGVPVKIDENLLSFEDATHEFDISKFKPPGVVDSDSEPGTREFDPSKLQDPDLTASEEVIGRGSLAERTIDDYRKRLSEEVGDTGDPRARIARLVERAEKERSDGHAVAAVVAAELAFDEDPTSAGAQKALHEHQDRLSEIYAELVGEFERCPRLARPLHEIPLGELDHRSAFLLSRIDGNLSFDDILDISGMPRFEALRTLGRLMLHGYLEVE